MEKAIYNIKQEGFEGWAKIKLLKHKERTNLMKECNFNLTEDLSAEAINNNIDAMNKLLDITPKYIVDMEITHKKTNTTAKTWEDTEYYNDWVVARQEIAYVILRGVSLGEN